MYRCSHFSTLCLKELGIFTPISHNLANQTVLEYNHPVKFITFSNIANYEVVSFWQTNSQGIKQFYEDIRGRHNIFEGIDPSMHNAEKWPNMLLKFCGVHNFFELDCVLLETFYKIVGMNESVIGETILK